MKFEFNKKYTTIAAYAFLVLAAVVLFYDLLKNLGYFYKQIAMITKLLLPFIYGFALAYMLNPVLKFFEHRVLDRAFKDRLSDKVKRSISIFITYICAIGVLSVFVMIVVPQLVASVTGLITKLSQYINSADTWMPVLLSYFPDLDLPATISMYLQQYADKIAQTGYKMLTEMVPWMVSLSTRFASGLLAIVVGVIVSIYILADKERFCAGAKKIWYAFLPQKKADWLLELTWDANRVFGGFISGKILDSLIISVLCFVCMSLMNMPNVMLISVIVGVTNVIPYFGPFIGAIPSFFIILIDNPIKALWFLVFILILQQFDGNILGPKILGDSTGLSAFWVVFSIMLFGGLYGFMGMFLGVPVFSVIVMLLRRLINANLTARSMPVDIESYCAPESPLPRPSAREAARKSEETQKEKGGSTHKVKPIERKSKQ